MLNRHHGGNDLSLDISLDFSANLNPLGMPEKVREAVIASAAGWEKYPDPLCGELRGKLSQKLGVPVCDIVCGNGADDLIYRIVSALRPKRALICAPAFGEYRKALSEYGCTVDEHFLRIENDFALTESILDSIAGSDMLILASPNNPTGQIIKTELLAAIAEKCSETGAYFLCDESFIGFSPESEKLTALNLLNGNTIVLRSFTKLFAMAGLRIGYTVCGSRAIAEKISASGQYWSVSAPAQAAGIAALDENDYIKRTADLIKSEREHLAAELAGMGVKVFPSDTDFILFKARDDLGELLLERKILIRSCADFSGLDGGFFRTAVRTGFENEQLIAAIRRIMNG